MAANLFGRAPGASHGWSFPNKSNDLLGHTLYFEHHWWAVGHDSWGTATKDFQAGSWYGRRLDGQPEERWGRPTKSIHCNGRKFHCKFLASI
jgi:hypothetical protein